MSVSDRIKKLEKRPQPQRPHGMTNQELDLRMQSMDARSVQAFIKSMTNDDLNAHIEYLKATQEQQHAKP